MVRQRFEGTALKSWEEVDLNLKEIGELDLQKEAIEADMNLKISDIKLEAADKIKPLLESKEKLEMQIKEFVEENRADIKGKTMALNFGQTGFRQSTKIIIRSIASVLKMLKAKGMADCITIKEEVSKDKLKEYSDEVIASVGARKKVEDIFWYEVNREKLSKTG